MCWVCSAPGCNRSTGFPSMSTTNFTSVPRGHPSSDNVDNVPSLQVSITVLAASAGVGRSNFPISISSFSFATTPSAIAIAATVCLHLAPRSLSHTPPHCSLGGLKNKECNDNFHHATLVVVELPSCCFSATDSTAQGSLLCNLAGLSTKSIAAITATLIDAGAIVNATRPYLTRKLTAEQIR